MNFGTSLPARRRDRSLADALAKCALGQSRRTHPTAQDRRATAARLGQFWNEQMACQKTRASVGKHTLREALKHFSQHRMVKELWTLPEVTGACFSVVSRALLIAYSRRGDVAGLARVRAAMHVKGVAPELEDYVLVARGMARGHGPVSQLLRIITLVKQAKLTSPPRRRRPPPTSGGALHPKLTCGHIFQEDHRRSPEEVAEVRRQDFLALYRAALTRCTTAAERGLLTRLAADDGLGGANVVLATLTSCRATADLPAAEEVLARCDTPIAHHTTPYNMYVLVHVAAGSFDVPKAYAAAAAERHANQEAVGELLLSYVKTCQIHMAEARGVHRAFAEWACGYYSSLGCGDDGMKAMLNEMMELYRMARDPPAAEAVIDRFARSFPDDVHGMHRLSSQYADICRLYMDGCPGPFAAGAASEADKAAWRDLPCPPHAAGPVSSQTPSPTSLAAADTRVHAQLSPF
eukprot:TRINITY_DN7482_c0_g1_i1.p1 TRINITY_DN7482_c0_g1~~TRINITY_DN7482_c0_g1_i1.p1  ORF type:complete len:464 (+),score=114.25 TRINITY_DN7482_c0_g1_i1:383-1774(+)